METARSRVRKVLAGGLPEDRLPMMEWATWWDKTIARWEGEGLPAGMSKEEIKRWLGLDVDHQLWLRPLAPDFPHLERRHGEGMLSRGMTYEDIRPYLYPDPVPFERDVWRARAAEQEAGEAVIWITLEGFFWWPRTVFGIERHLYAFYDEPELYHRICEDVLDYQVRCLRALDGVFTPDFMTFAEDMSYNHGPMLSKDLFDEFMAPWYRRIIPEVTARGIVPIIDSDGGIEPLIPWFEEVGIAGILPLERMAGVDVNRIRLNHPKWIMLGGYDKMVMHLGAEARRAEFERILPAMRSGGFIPSVDHQTPPGVPMSEYLGYVAELREYAALACAQREG